MIRTCALLLSGLLSSAPAPAPWDEAIRPAERPRLLPPGGETAFVELELGGERGAYRGSARWSLVNRTGAPQTTLIVRLFPERDVGATPRLQLLEARQAGAKLTFRELTKTRVEIVLPVPVPPDGRFELDVAFRGQAPALTPEAIDPMQALLGTMGPAALEPRPTPPGSFAVGPSGGMLLEHLVPLPEGARMDGRPETEEPSRRGAPAQHRPLQWLVAVLAPPNVALGATGCEVGAVPEADGRVRTTFVAAAVSDFALVALPDGVREQRTERGVKLTALVPASLELHAGRLLDGTARALGALEEGFGRPYPWSCLTTAAVELPGGFASEEAPNLAVVGAAHLAPPAGLPADPEAAIAHGLSHQWFSGLVPFDGQREPILAEAFAGLGEQLVAEKHGASRAAAHRALLDGLRIVQGDAIADRPEAKFESDSERSAMLNGKGPLGLTALRKALGPKDFALTLQSFLKARAGRLSDRADLLAAVPAKRRPAAEALLNAHWSEARADELFGPPDPLAALARFGLGGGSLPGLGGAGKAPAIRITGPNGRPLTAEEQRQVDEAQKQFLPMWEQAIRALGGTP